MPGKYNPIQGTNVAAIVPQLNRAFATLDKETTVKKFGGNNGTTGLTIGKTGETTKGMVVAEGDKKILEVGIYQDGRAGILIYDDDGVPVALFGQAPDDGRPGAWVVSEGKNVLELLGG